MGTRADFYIGRGKKAKWIGSIAWDGYPAGLMPGSTTVTDKKDIPKTPVLAAKTGKDFRKAVTELLKSREDGTFPEQGWPWPWENSDTTDYAYAFDDGQVWGTCFGHGWWRADRPEPEDHDKAPKGGIEWPTFGRQKMAVPGGPRSGLMVFTVK